MHEHACRPSVLLAALTVGAATAAASGETGDVTLSVSIDGAVAYVATLFDLGGPVGQQHYQGTVLGPANKWRLTWDILVDADPSELFLVSSEIAMLNRLGSEKEFDLRLDVPICPEIAGPTTIGGSTVIKLTTDQEGGRVRNGSSSAIWYTLVGGQRVASLLWSPFLMQISGSGTAMTSDDFGLPLPSAPGFGSGGSLGIEHTFKCTHADTVRFTSEYALTADLDALVPCGELGDFDGDGLVTNDDIEILVENWGDCPATGDCPWDLNGDGIVDLEDLTILLTLLHGG